MAKTYNYEVMFDDASIDVSKEVALVWSIANSLRGAYTSDKYKDVIIPMVIIRRFECALAATKQAVVDKHKMNPNIPAALLEKESGYPFYNTSEFTLARLLNDSDNIASNFQSYIEGFSANVQTILNNLDITKQIEKLDKNNRLYGIVKKFSEIDFDPNSVDGMRMGYIFEDIIRRFSENAEAGDHYTPREVIRLLVNILLAEGCNDLLTDEGKVATVLDAACGSGGMLSIARDFLKRKNPYVDVRLFGQEINPESYAICMADMMIKGQDARNIRGGDDFEQLKEMNPRSAADEKKYQKYLSGQKFVADVLAVLEANLSDEVYMDYAEFEKHLKKLLEKVEGYSASRLTGIVMVLSEMDKTAVVQKDKKGGIIVDPTTKDTELIKLTKDPKEYFEEEVYAVF